MKGQRRLSVLHARICNNCSDLKSNFFQNEKIVVEEILMKMLSILFSNIKTTVIQE